MTLLLLTMFVMGLITGSMLTVVYSVLHTRKRLKKIQGALMKELLGKAEKLTKAKEIDESIKDRLIKASNIGIAQLEIRSKIETPSKNALHSHHKNGLLSELMELEQQKLSLLRSILGDGFDPTIKIQTETGAEESMLLSQYVGQAEHDLSHGTSSDTAANKDGPKKVGKFILHKGGKDDDGTTH